MKLLTHARQVADNVLYEWSARRTPIKPSVHHKTPYVCQFAKPEHAELSLKKVLHPLDDPHWQDIGAASPEQYAQWAFTMCGMASAAMALGFFHNKSHAPVALAEDALEHGVYTREPDGISSMRYREFSRWITKYGLTARVVTKLSIRGIIHALSHNKLVIVSVNPNIRGYDTAPTDQTGGHLVLVVGYDQNKGTITLQNPSGFTSLDSQINHTLPTAEFTRFYAGRGIVLAPSSSPQGKGT